MFMTGQRFPPAISFPSDDKASSQHDSLGNASSTQQTKQQTQVWARCGRRGRRARGWAAFIDSNLRLPQRLHVLFLFFCCGMMNILDAFAMSPSDCRDLAACMCETMEAGLSGPSEMRMLPSYVCAMPTGDEEGVFYALDLGGTNFRVLRVVLSPGGKHEVKSKKYALSPELYQGHGAELFLFLAQCIKDTIVSLGDDPSPPKPHHLGFTFSFPCDQTALDAGRLVWWTKGFTCAGVEGEEVVGLLQKALSLPEVGVKVHVEALVNDTVGTLMAKKRSDPACAVGVIFGTGTNACYIENIKGIPKLGRASDEGVMCINMEWGNFGQSEGSLAKLPWSEVDGELDAASSNPGQQRLEKLIGGMYMGEVCRLALNRMVKAGEFSCPVGEGGQGLVKKSSEDMARILEFGGDTAGLISILNQHAGFANANAQDAEKVHAVCDAVVKRAGMVGGAAIAGVLLHAKYLDSIENGVSSTSPPVGVGIDGSVFKNVPLFRDGVAAGIAAVLGDVAASNVVLELSEDGSGLGAAVIACTASSV